MQCNRLSDLYQRHLVKDWDDVFAFETPRIAIIRDRHLGLLSIFFKVCIIFYIFFFEICYSKNYLTCERPTGEVLAKLVWQPALADGQCELLGHTRTSHTKFEAEEELLQRTDSQICNGNSTAGEGGWPSDDQVSQTTCRFVGSAELTSTSSVNYFKVPVMYITKGDVGQYKLAYVRDLEYAYAQLQLQVASTFYQEDQRHYFGGYAGEMVEKLVFKNDSVVKACDEADGFYGYGNNMWDILATCEDETRRVADKPCKSSYGSDLVLPLYALLSAADIDLDESLQSHAQRTGDSDMYDMCKKRVKENGIFGWVKSSSAWEKLKRLYALNETAYPSTDSLFFLGLQESEVQTATYEELMGKLENFCKNVTLRQFGIRLSVAMTHDNMQGSRKGTVNDRLFGRYAPSTIHTNIKVMAAIGNAVGPRFIQGESWDGYGYYTNDLEVVISHYGEICRFDQSVLLTTLTSALGLLVVSQTIVSFLMLHLMPLRDMYYKEKFVVTQDYSDVRAHALKEVSEVQCPNLPTQDFDNGDAAKWVEDTATKKLEVLEFPELHHPNTVQ